MIQSANRFFLTGSLLVALSAPACGNKGGGAGGATSSSSTSTTAATSATTVASTTSTGGSAACDSAKAALPASCVDCISQACGTEWADCCATTTFGASGPTSGCAPVAACAIATGCVHVTCYQPSTCKSQIDAAGGITSPAISKASTLGDCIKGSSLPSCAACLGAGGG